MAACLCPCAAGWLVTTRRLLQAILVLRNWRHCADFQFVMRSCENLCRRRSSHLDFSRRFDLPACRSSLQVPAACLASTR